VDEHDLRALSANCPHLRGVIINNPYYAPEKPTIRFSVLMDFLAALPRLDSLLLPTPLTQLPPDEAELISTLLPVLRRMVCFAVSVHGSEPCFRETAAIQARVPWCELGVTYADTTG